MSQVYASEPPTTGRVIFDTSHGPLEISLWCKECPHTTRWFLQLCLDGFYDNILVHRILPDTLLQCGALRSVSDASQPPEAVNLTTDKGRAAWQTYRTATQATTALERQRHELHSRLRFRHRGIVAMALPLGDDKTGNLSDDDLWQQQPQFFITLDATPYLDGQHVIFGTVSGPTVFNALRMGNRSIEVEESTGRPLDWAEAPVFRSVKIVDNPLHQDAVVPQPTLPWRSSTAGASTLSSGAKPKKKKRKGKLDTNVLSFGDELDEDGGGGGISLVRPVAKKSKSSKQAPSEEEEQDIDTNDTKIIPETKPSLVKQQESIPKPATLVQPPPDHNPAPQTVPPSSSTQQQVNAPKQPKMSAMEARRAKYASAKKGKKNKRNTEDETLAKLQLFQSRVKETIGERRSNSIGNNASGTMDNSLAARMARRANAAAGQASSHSDQVETYHGQVLEGKDDSVDVQGSSNWMATTFKCKQHMDHKAGSDGRTVEDYKVVDDQKESSDNRRHKDSSRHRHHHQRHHHHDRPRHSNEHHRHRKPAEDDNQDKPARIRGGGGGDSISSRRTPGDSFQGLFPKKRRQTEAPAETVLASTGFPVSSRPKKKLRKDQNGKGTKDNERKQEKFLDWHETAHEVRRLGASAFIKQQKRDFQDEEYLKLTGRERKKHQVPLPIVRGIKKKQAQREAAALAEARASGMVLPKQVKKEKTKESRDARWNGPAPSIGLVKKGILHLKRKPT